MPQAGEFGGRAGSERELAGGQELVTSQTFVSPQQPPGLFGKVLQRPVFARHHVMIEIRRAPHSLAGVVDDEIQSFAGLEQMPAEGFHARSVAQIETKGFESVPPVVEIRFAGIARSGVAREARCDDELRHCPQQLDASLISDLYAPTGEECYSSAQIGQFRSFAEVQLGARRTELIVKRVKD